MENIKKKISEPSSKFGGGGGGVKPISRTVHCVPQLKIETVNIKIKEYSRQH
jgi:hypothetical protein